MHFVSTSRTAQRSWEKARDRTREGGKARAGLSWFNEAFPNASGMDLCHSLTAYGEVLGILPWSPLMQSNMLYMHGIGLWHCINQYPFQTPNSTSIAVGQSMYVQTWRARRSRKTFKPGRKRCEHRISGGWTSWLRSRRLSRTGLLDVVGG